MTLPHTQALIMITMILGLFTCSAMSIYKWNDVASAAIVLGFIATVQLLVEDVFDAQGADRDHCYVAWLAGVLYIALVILSLHKWNIAISAEVGTGLAVFLLKIAREYVKAQAIAVANFKLNGTGNGKTIELPKTDKQIIQG